MEEVRLGKNVRRVTVLERDASTGTVTPVVLFQNNEKQRKKRTRVLKPIERVVRRIVDAQGQTADSYLLRHTKSNRKKRDGWIRDLNLNVLRASRKGAKKLKLNRLLAF